MTPSTTTDPLVFWKLDGAGNDFIAFDNRTLSIPEGFARDRLVHTLCDRRTGVGTDGALFLEPPRDPAAADVRMRYHNRDGGEAEMCGNGARCLAAFAHHLGAAPARGMRIETLGGLQRADILPDNAVRLYLPDVPPVRPIDALHVDEWTGHADFFTIGVPQAVVWVDNLATLPVDGLGRALRRHPAFAPAGSNINFAAPAPGVGAAAAVKSSEAPEAGVSSNSNAASSPAAFRRAPAKVYVRTYERGVECETLACGTGSVATAISAVLAGRAAPPVAVHVRGDVDLLIDFEILPGGGARHVTLTGPALLLFRAETRWNPSTGEVLLD